MTPSLPSPLQGEGFRLERNRERTFALDPRRQDLLRQCGRAQRRRCRRQRGRDRRPDRRQRRRQIDADDDGVRQSAGPRRRNPFRRPRHYRAADARDRQAPHRAIAGGPAHFFAHDGDGKLADRRHRHRCSQHRSRRGTRIRPVSAAAGTPQAARRYVVRRRAADAGDRARADEPAAAHPARRAVARSGAAPRATNLRRNPRAERTRQSHRLPRRAERFPRAQARASRLCHGQRRNHLAGPGPRSVAAARNPRRLPGRWQALNLTLAAVPLAWRKIEQEIPHQQC